MIFYACYPLAALFCLDVLKEKQGASLFSPQKSETALRELDYLYVPLEEIRGKMADLMNRRKTSQPLDLPSAGSAFKRPVGGYAAAMIDQAGLKGFCVGGAGVSTKHAGFVVNNGGATAADVKEVLRQVAEKVYENTGIRLEPEVRIW